MRILLVQNIYNEIKLLPWKMAWAADNGFDSFTWDNYSTDGSYEWLQDQGYRVIRYYTNGMFSLAINNRNVLDTIHWLEDVKPDWVVAAGADMFYSVMRNAFAEKKADFAGSIMRKDVIRKMIEEADKAGYNLIDCSRLWNFYYTGIEDDNQNPRVEYRYYREARDFEICLIAKYHPYLRIDGDRFMRPDGIIYHPADLVTLHYWLRSDAKARRTEHYYRRKKAWERGIDRACQGTHYPKMVSEDKWVWERSSLQSAVLSRQSSVSSPQSAVLSQQSSVGSQQSASDGRKGKG
jgi:hypothetical protein